MVQLAAGSVPLVQVNSSRIRSPVIGRTVENESRQTMSPSESEQDSTITSSSSSPEIMVSVLEGDEESTGSSDVNEQELKTVIDLLEERVIAEEPTGGNEAVVTASHIGTGSASGNSVEYWTLSQGKPKHFLRRYSGHRHSRNFRRSNGSRRAGNNQLWTSNTGIDPNSNLFGPMPSQIFNTNLLTPPLHSSHFIPFPNHPHILQAPSLQVYPPPTLTPVPHLPSIQIFIPPEQSWTPPASSSQYIPSYPVSNLLPTTTLYPFPQQQQYVHNQYYSGEPLSQNGFPLHSASTQASYFQGAPVYYQVPPTPMAGMNPLAQPFVNDVSYLGGYERPLEYPPPTYEDAILTSSISPANDLITPEQTAEMEVDSSINEVTEAVHDQSWQFQNCFATPSMSPTATPSSSDTTLNSIDHTGLGEVSGDATSGYSSSSSPMVSATSSPTNLETPTAESTVGSRIESIANVGISSGDETSPLLTMGPESDLAQKSEEIARNVNHDGLEQYSMELRAFNSACINMVMPATVYDVNTVSCQSQHQQNLMVYPGVQSILMYSQNDGIRSVVLYNEQEVPYVANVFDFRVQATFKEQCGPALTYPYYVPPRTADNDFFGGQLAIWQLKLGQYFLKFQPHNWKMHGVPETFNTEMFLGRVMDVVGEFHIVSKLRFSCRTCSTPWTSKKGTIVFKFCFNSTLKLGWILMRIFGQICMRKECSDWTFQNPACYPEEIDRAMKKLSEYIGSQCYGIAVKPNCFDECFKSIRRSGNVGNNNSGNKERERVHLPPTPHKKEFCQACMNGVCKNLFARPFIAQGQKRIQIA